jgi:hypothetical protein
MINYESQLEQLLNKKDYDGASELLDKMSEIYTEFGKFNKKIRQNIIKNSLSHDSIEGMHLTHHSFCHHENISDIVEMKDFTLKLIVGKGQYHLLEQAILADYISVANLTVYLINTKNTDALKHIQNKTNIKLDYAVLVSTYDTIFSDSDENTFKFLDSLKKDVKAANTMITRSFARSVMSYNLKAIDYLFVNEKEKMPKIMDKWLSYIKDNRKSKFATDEWCFFEDSAFHDRKGSYFIDILKKLKSHYPFSIDEPIQKYFIELFMHSRMPSDKLSQEVITFLNGIEEIEKKEISENTMQFILNCHSIKNSSFAAYYEKNKLEKSMIKDSGHYKKIKL